jgi:cyclopropane fatty-acyl-phospholipid synthase-like methyltransferase
MKRSRGPDHFQRLYESSADPWNLAGSRYEAAKYRHTLDTLGSRYFTTGLEVGCSIGVLTRLLAARCETLLAIDIVEAPLRLARARCADLTQVRFARMQTPQEWPEQVFDLVVLSEILYFLSPDDIAYCARRVSDWTSPHAVVLLVNWLGRSDDPSTGDEAADRFIAALAGLFRLDLSERTQQYRIDRLVCKARYSSPRANLKETRSNPLSSR